ncbi:MAG: CD225/dispanin family protein [Nitrospirae bacterium]|nr:CD225/dispanin family protein [Nitrospirota bacterium]
MHCGKCGTQNEDGAFKCIRCGDILIVISDAPLPQPKIPSYLLPSILLTILSCLPLGIVAIVYAAKVNKKMTLDDYAGAAESSKKAKMWCWLAFGGGVGFFIVRFIILMIVSPDGHF